MKIKISFFGALMIVALILTRAYLSLAAMLAAFMHEMGHLIVAKCYGVKIRELRLDIFGAALTPEKAFCSYKKEIAVAIGGPLVNMLFALFGTAFFEGGGAFFDMLVASSFFLGTLNLLPINDFDGGRILRCLLSYFFSVSVADAVCAAASFVILIAMWMLSVYMMLQFGATVSLFVFSFALLCKTISLNKS